MRTKVTVKGLGGVKAQFEGELKEVTAIVGQELESMAKDWVGGAKRDAPVDQGTLKNGISYLVNDRNVEIFSNVFYSPFIEFGTKGRYRPIPGTEKIAEQFRGYKGGDIMEMLRMIVRWVHRKGITGTYSVKTRRRTGSKVNQYAEDYSAAWPILLSILKNGIMPHPYFFKQMDVVWPKMIDNVKSRLQKNRKISVIMPGELSRPRIVTI